MTIGAKTIGFCGKKYGNTMRDISSINIRISRDIYGVSDAFEIFPLLSTLVISPPGGGKTTFLRDAARRISNGGKGCVL